jgi:hypothetical protein
VTRRKPKKSKVLRGGFPKYCDVTKNTENYQLCSFAIFCCARVGDANDRNIHRAMHDMKHDIITVVSRAAVVA